MAGAGPPTEKWRRLVRAAVPNPLKARWTATLGERAGAPAPPIQKPQAPSWEKYGSQPPCRRARGEMLRARASKTEKVGTPVVACVSVRFNSPVHQPADAPLLVKERQRQCECQRQCQRRPDQEASNHEKTFLGIPHAKGLSVSTTEEVQGCSCLERRDGVTLLERST